MKTKEIQKIHRKEFFRYTGKRLTDFQVGFVKKVLANNPKMTAKEAIGNVLDVTMYNECPYEAGEKRHWGAVSTHNERFSYD